MYINLGHSYVTNPVPLLDLVYNMDKVEHLSHWCLSEARTKHLWLFPVFFYPFIHPFLLYFPGTSQGAAPALGLQQACLSVHLLTPTTAVLRKPSEHKLACDGSIL